MASTTASSTQASTTTPLSPDEARISAALAQDRPTIDVAVKSFLSLVCARGMTASVTDQDDSSQKTVLMGMLNSGGEIPTTSSRAATTTIGPSNQHALQVARAILQSCNAHQFPIHKTVADALQDKPGLTPDKKEQLMELSVVARLWNGLIQSKQKPTRFLGRQALRHAWPDMNVTSKLVPPAKQDESAATLIYNQQLAWIQEFERHLFHEPNADPNATTMAEDNDAALLWDADGGQAELARRRKRRQSAATERGPVTPS